MEQPVREEPLAHQCVCLLVHQQANPEMGADGTVGVVLRRVQDKCYAIVSDPDSPFCTMCETAGHPNLHEQAAERVVKRP